MTSLFKTSFDFIVKNFHWTVPMGMITFGAFGICNEITELQNGLSDRIDSQIKGIERMQKFATKEDLNTHITGNHIPDLSTLKHHYGIEDMRIKIGAAFISGAIKGAVVAPFIVSPVGSVVGPTLALGYYLGKQ